LENKKVNSKSLRQYIRGWFPRAPKLSSPSGPIQRTSGNKPALLHTTKTRVVLGTAGLVLYGALTYLFLKNIIDNSTWIGLGALELFIISIIQYWLRAEKRKRADSPQDNQS